MHSARCWQLKTVKTFLSLLYLSKPFPKKYGSFCDHTDVQHIEGVDGHQTALTSNRIIQGWLLDVVIFDAPTSFKCSFFRVVQGLFFGDLLWVGVLKSSLNSWLILQWLKPCHKQRVVAVTTKVYDNSVVCLIYLSTFIPVYKTL